MQPVTHGKVKNIGDTLYLKTHPRRHFFLFLFFSREATSSSTALHIVNVVCEQEKINDEKIFSTYFNVRKLL